MSYTMCMCACSYIYIEHCSNHVDTLISLWENFEPQILIRFARVYTYYKYIVAYNIPIIM